MSGGTEHSDRTTLEFPKAHEQKLKKFVEWLQDPEGKHKDFFAGMPTIKFREWKAEMIKKPAAPTVLMQSAKRPAPSGSHNRPGPSKRVAGSSTRVTQKYMEIDDEEDEEEDEEEEGGYAD